MHKPLRIAAAVLGSVAATGCENMTAGENAAIAAGLLPAYSVRMSGVGGADGPCGGTYAACHRADGGRSSRSM
ncbi:MAG: hypothetical protein ACO39C_09590, partial [Chthoniobacterales bacterium]